MASSTVQHIIDVKFQYADLVKGWSETSAAIESATKKLNEFTKDTPREEIVKQTNLIKALKNNLNQLTKEIQANVKIESQQVGSINQLNTAITKLTARYNALSRTEREGAKGKAFENKIRQLKTEVNAANASLLDFRNNVGNYAGGVVEGFTRLGFSVQQVARELPSLSHSVSQFFLAISNNLPMLADELQRATKANAALKAEGKATVPVWKQLTKSIFSWQSLLVVGITLLSAYGKEIVSFVKGLFGAKEAAISMAKAQQNVNAELQKNGFGIGDQIAKFESLRQAWNNLAGDLDAKKKFVAENKEAFQGLGVEIGNVNEAENLLVNNSEAFINTLKARAMASAGMILAAEKYAEALKAQKEAEDKIAKGYFYYETPQKRTKFGRGNAATVFRAASPTLKRREYTEAEKKEIMAETKALEQQAESYVNIANAKLIEAKSTLKAANIKESAGGTGGAETSTFTSIKLKAFEKRLKAISTTKVFRESVIRQRREFEQIQEEAIAEGFESTEVILRKKQAEYENRIMSAMLAGGVNGGYKEMAAIAQEQINVLKEQIEDVDTFRAHYREMGMSEIEIDNMRLDLKLRLQKAEGDLQSINQRANNEAIQGAESVAGSLGQLASASKDSAAASAIFSIAQGAVAMGAALAKAFTTTSNVWEGIAAAITAISTVVSFISQIKALNSSASEEAQKYATGGLVTGPGTSTSDSITAKLSNGEAVMTAKAVQDWGAVLSAMNVSSGGRAIDTSNLPQRGGGMEGMKQLMKEVMLEMPAPVVSVVDINRGQSRVKVADNLGRLKARNKA